MFLTDFYQFFFGGSVGKEGDHDGDYSFSSYIYIYSGNKIRGVKSELDSDDRVVQYCLKVKVKK